MLSIQLYRDEVHIADTVLPLLRRTRWGCKTCVYSDQCVDDVWVASIVCCYLFVQSSLGWIGRTCLEEMHVFCRFVNSSIWRTLDCCAIYHVMSPHLVLYRLLFLLHFCTKSMGETQSLKEKQCGLWYEKKAKESPNHLVHENLQSFKMTMTLIRVCSSVSFTWFCIRPQLFCYLRTRTRIKLMLLLDWLKYSVLL